MSMDNEQGGVAMSDVAEIALINRIEAAGAEEQRAKAYRKWREMILVGEAFEKHCEIAFDAGYRAAIAAASLRAGGGE